MKKIKHWLKYKLRQALAIPALEESVDRISTQLTNKRDDTGLFGLSYWYEGNLWEPPVQLALRDLCKPGNVVFDVGANFGGLTTVMSRMVGLNGRVCAFEASPRIVDKCQRNLVLNGCNNVQLYHAAVFSKSHEQVAIYLGSHLNDSIYSQNSTDTPAFNINTLALDDFINFTGLVPNLVKMDIEGAEFDAIKGMLNTISHHQPHLILETQPSDTRCLDLLRREGYIAIDLNSYREIKSPDDYPANVEIRNNLYIHQDKLTETPYKPPFTFVEEANLTPKDFTNIGQSLITLEKPLQLNKGRYLIEVDFTAQGTDNEMMCGVKVGEKQIFRYHAFSKILAENYKDWVIDLPIKSDINIFFEFINNTFDKTLSIKGAKIIRIGEFDNVNSNLYI
ncbi:MAG TPA: FkbM family methyltransferase [Nostocaceae cyanobacterium]|nr:FkbM family methyltransferase [Nostocaceae cyanobacterium]